MTKMKSPSVLVLLTTIWTIALGTTGVNAAGSAQDAMGLGGNNAGSTTTEVPRFLSKGGTHRAVIGDNVILPCQVEYLGRYVVLWKRGNAVLSAGDMKITVEPRIHLHENLNLEISKLRIHDAGDYICQISTLTPQDQVHTLEILVPPSIRSEPNNDHVTITKGDTVSLQCRANGNPAPTVKWIRKNNILPSGEEFVEGNSYIIKKADRHYSGVYICSAGNGVGMPVSTSIHVNVQYGPEVDVERSWIHSGEGYEAELACIVHSDPPSTVKWFQETMLLDTTTKRLAEERGTRHSLVIRKVQASDFGNYSCEADNKFGRAQGHMELSGRPNRVVFRSDPNGRMRDSFNITWLVESFSPVFEYTLLYRRAQINSTRYLPPGEWHDIVLPVEDTTSSQQSQSLLPGAITALEAARPVSASIVHVKSYHIRNLEPEVLYEAQVSAKNKYGLSSPSDIFSFSTSSSDSRLFEPSPHEDTLTGAGQEVRGQGLASLSASPIIRSQEKILLSSIMAIFFC